MCAHTSTSPSASTFHSSSEPSPAIQEMHLEQASSREFTPSAPLTSTNAVGSWYRHTHLPYPQEGHSVVCVLYCPPKVPSGIEFQLPTVGAMAPLLAAFAPCLTHTISYQIVQVSLLKGTPCTRVCFWEKPYKER